MIVLQIVTQLLLEQHLYKTRNYNSNDKLSSIAKRRLALNYMYNTGRHLKVMWEEGLCFMVNAFVYIMYTNTKV